MMAPMRLSRKPALAMSIMEIFLEPNIMALGAVAMGSINAIDAEKVAVTIRVKALNPVADAKDARMGRSIWVVDILDVSSVRNVTETAMMAVTTITGDPANKVSFWPR